MVPFDQYGKTEMTQIELWECRVVFNPSKHVCGCDSH